MTAKTGYKANRLSVQQRRDLARKKAWESLDLPEHWKEDAMADRLAMKRMLEAMGREEAGGN